MCNGVVNVFCDVEPSGIVKMLAKLVGSCSEEDPLESGLTVFPIISRNLIHLSSLELVRVLTVFPSSGRGWAFPATSELSHVTALFGKHI